MIDISTESTANTYGDSLTSGSLPSNDEEDIAFDNYVIGLERSLVVIYPEFSTSTEIIFNADQNQNGLNIP